MKMSCVSVVLSALMVILWDQVHNFSIPIHELLIDDLVTNDNVSYVRRHHVMGS